jgi:tetratricopeptide (TPR) repeat protein
MKTNILQKMRSVLTLSVVLFAFASFAQDINKAGEIFNAGNQALKDGNSELAIQKYEQSIEMASKLGAEGENIISSAKAQIPGLYYKMGAEDYKSGNTEKAIGEFENAIKFGELYADAETVTKAKDVMPKLYYARGNDFYKEEKFAEALASFQQSRELDPKYSRSIWGIGLAYGKLGEFDKLDEAFTDALKVAQTEADTKMVDKINQTAKKLLQAEGATKLQTQSWDLAVKYLNAALKYDEGNKDIYYYLGLAYNGLKKWDEAITSTQKGLDLSTAENDDFKAKFYYEMGNAYKGKAENDKACEAFKKATFGRFTENANYEIKTTLKCK